MILKDINQGELANILHIDSSSISRILNGKIKPTEKFKNSFKLVFGFPLDELPEWVEREKKKTAVKDAVCAGKSEYETEGKREAETDASINALLSKLDGKEREEILNHILTGILTFPLKVDLLNHLAAKLIQGHDPPPARIHGSHPKNTERRKEQTAYPGTDKRKNPYSY